MPAPFSKQEYDQRLARVRASMSESNLDALVIGDPANMNWLTGFDAWSFYVPQVMLVTHQQPPVWMGRMMDAGAVTLTILAKNNVQIGETVDAQAKLGQADALRLAGDASRIVVAQGKSVTTFQMTKDRPSDEMLLRHMLGPTGNLRAPTIKKGNTLLVGFNEEVYAETI